MFFYRWYFTIWVLTIFNAVTLAKAVRLVEVITIAGHIGAVHLKDFLAQTRVRTHIAIRFPFHHHFFIIPNCKLPRLQVKIESRDYFLFCEDQIFYVIDESSIEEDYETGIVGNFAKHISRYVLDPQPYEEGLHSIFEEHVEDSWINVINHQWLFGINEEKLIFPCAIGFFQYIQIVGFLAANEDSRFAQLRNDARRIARCQGEIG